MNKKRPKQPLNPLQSLERQAEVGYQEIFDEILVALGASFVSYSVFNSVPNVKGRVSKVMEGADYAQRFKDVLTGASVAAANEALGPMARVKTDQYIKWRLGEVYDGVALSQTLRDNAAQTAEILTDTIRAQLKAGGTWTQLAQKIQTHDKVADVAGTLADLAKAGKKLGVHPQEINRLVRRAQFEVNKLSPNGAPTKYLKNAYQKLIDTVEKGAGENAINAALGKAMNAKIKYNAERISRTELARAHNEGFHARWDDDSQVTGYAWKLSSRHSITDECTLLAELDNGAGPGVYRKEDCPYQPVHPNCMCMLGIHTGEVPAPVKFTTVRDYLKEQPDKRRGEMIGKRNAVHETLYRRGMEKHNIHFGGEAKRVPEELIEPVPAENSTEGLISEPESGIFNYRVLNAEDIEKLQGQSDETYAKFTEAERDEVHRYTGTKAADINYELHRPDKLTDDTRQRLPFLDSAIGKFDLRDDLVAFRGVDEHWYDEWKVGDNKPFGGYMSTSLSRDVAETMGGLVIEINVPRGTESLFIGMYSKHPEEVELLIGRGQRFNVLERSKNYMKVEVARE